VGTPGEHPVARCVGQTVGVLLDVGQVLIGALHDGCPGLLRIRCVLGERRQLHQAERRGIAPVEALGEEELRVVVQLVRGNVVPIAFFTGGQVQLGGRPVVLVGDVIVVVGATAVIAAGGVLLGVGQCRLPGGFGRCQAGRGEVGVVFLEAPCTLGAGRRQVEGRGGRRRVQVTGLGIVGGHHRQRGPRLVVHLVVRQDRKSTRLNSSHVSISY